MKIEHDIERANRHNFRACLEALARPGETYFLEPVFDSGLLAMASLLLFGETSYFYRGTKDFELVRAICGARQCDAEEADYLFADDLDPELLEKAKSGTSDNPEFGATILLGRDLFSTPETEVELSGPGIKGHRRMLLPLSVSFISKQQEKNENFPMGVDIYLIGQDHSLLGLPRTTRIEVLS